MKKKDMADRKKMKKLFNFDRDKKNYIVNSWKNANDGMISSAIFMKSQQYLDFSYRIMHFSLTLHEIDFR
jgi:hypothetical protein